MGCSAPKSAVKQQTTIAVPIVSSTFKHPGLLQTVADLERIKTKVAAKEEPWLSGYKVFNSNPFSSAYYTVKGGFSMVDRGSSNLNRTAFETDATAAYQNAIMWTITGTISYRDEALAIIKAWTKASTSFIGKDAQLIVGLDGFKFINAAEIMRYTNGNEWNTTDIAATETWFKTKFWPLCQAEGAPTKMLDGNWGMAAVKCQLAIGVFCNDTTLYNIGIANMTSGCASIPRNILPSGQESESGRDQGHTQLALGDMAEAALVAFNQGTHDFFADNNNLLLAGFEYTASYNLGNDVPFTPFGTCGHGNYNAISDKARCTTNPKQWRPIYELMYNHYKNTAISCPFTKQVADAHRPEANGFGNDGAGFGTLLYSK